MYVVLDNHYDQCMTMHCVHGWCDPAIGSDAHCICDAGFYGDLCEFSGTRINVPFEIKLMTW